jgi:hypothetical protein
MSMFFVRFSRESYNLRSTHGQADLEPAHVHQAGRNFRHYGMALAAQWLVGDCKHRWQTLPDRQVVG